MKLKTRSVTILTDDEVALVSGGWFTRGELTWPECNTLPDPWETYECHSRTCETEACITANCSITECDTYAQCDTAGQCDTTACPG